MSDRCSFCGAPSGDDVFLIQAAGTGAIICNRCVTKCTEILGRELLKAKGNNQRGRITINADYQG